MQGDATSTKLLPDVLLKHIGVLSLIYKHQYGRLVEFFKKFCQSSLSRALAEQEFNSLFDLLLGATKVSNLYISRMFEILASQLLY